MNESVETIYYKDKEIILVGTSHVSAESVALVKKIIDGEHPDTICVELDASRYDIIQNPQKWANTNVTEIIKRKKVGYLFVNLVLSSYQKNVGKKLNTTPGQEMMQGIKSAKEHGCNLVLADRDVQTTFMRIWRNLSVWNKCKLFVGLLFDFQDDESVNENDIADLMQKDNLEAAMSSISKDFPQITQILIHERDQHLAYKIKNSSGQKIVAVLGAAHIVGVKREIFKHQTLENIISVPKKSSLFKISAWSIPAVIVLLLLYGFVINFQTGVQQLTLWVLWNGIISALFTAIMMGHPLTIFTAFISAPITSLNPFIACGWFAGLVEATIRKPTVRDIDNVSDDIFHIKSFIKNRFLKALAIVIFANVGSTIGTIVAGTDIIKNLFWEV